MQQAVRLCGGQSELAKDVGTSKQNVYHWVATRPPAHWCKAIEDATEGMITREQLRPDIFGEPE